MTIQKIKLMVKTGVALVLGVLVVGVLSAALFLGVRTNQESKETRSKADGNEVACPLVAGANDILINFSQTIQANEEAASNFSVGTAIPPGEYQVSLASYDTHTGNPVLNEPREQYRLAVKEGENVLATTGVSDDIPDDRDIIQKVVNDSFSLTASASAVLVQHDAYPSTEPNLFQPLCALFRPLVAPPSSEGGRVNVCVVVANGERYLKDWSKLPETTFTIKVGPTPEGFSESSTVLPADYDKDFEVVSINSKENITTLLDGTYMASCKLANTLSYGYLYTRASVEGVGVNWLGLEYTDVFTKGTLTFYPYSGELFDSDLSNNASREQNADGNMFISPDRTDRKIVILAKTDAVIDDTGVLILSKTAESTASAEVLVTQAGTGGLGVDALDEGTTAVSEAADDTIVLDDLGGSADDNDYVYDQTTTTDDYLADASLDESYYQSVSQSGVGGAESGTTATPRPTSVPVPRELPNTAGEGPGIMVLVLGLAMLGVGVIGWKKVY